jgi:hypothetical protein
LQDEKHSASSDDDVSNDNISDDEGEREEKSEVSEQKKAFLAVAQRDLNVSVPDDVWRAERKCLLMLLEARMLLREMVEYKLKAQRMASGNLTVAEIMHLLKLNSDQDDDADFLNGSPSFRIFGFYFHFCAECIFSNFIFPTWNPICRVWIEKEFLPNPVFFFLLAFCRDSGAQEAAHEGSSP